MVRFIGTVHWYGSLLRLEFLSLRAMTRSWEDTRTAYLSIAIVCASIILIGCVVVQKLLLPWLRRKRKQSNALGYNAWLTQPPADGGADEQNNKTMTSEPTIALRDEVANYANERYPVDCNLRWRWHVFLRNSAVGRPYAVMFDRFLYTVNRIVPLDWKSGFTKNSVLRSRAKCVDSLIDSQFVDRRRTIDHDVSSDRRDLLLRLGERYSYEIEWETSKTEDGIGRQEDGNDEDATRLIVTFVDKARKGKRYSFAVDGFRPTVSPSDETKKTTSSVPPAWTIVRDTRETYVNAVKTDPDTNSPAVRNVSLGQYSYEESPCFDRRLGRQTAGSRPIADLKTYEELYLRGIQGRYPADQRPDLEKKLRDQFFIECRSDNEVNSNIVDDSVLSSVFPLRAFLRVCPSPTTHFDPVTTQCVTPSSAK